MTIFGSNKKKFLRLIDNKKDFIASIISVALLSLIGIFYLSNVNPRIEDIPNYDELTKNPYESFEKITNRRNIKKLINNKRFIEMKYDENLIKIEEPEKRVDPFLKNF